MKSSWHEVHTYRPAPNCGSIRGLTSRIITFALIFSMLMQAGCGAKGAAHIERDDWSEDVKTAVNTFVDTYGSGSDRYSKNSYVVSDFDNTASIFDTCEQFSVYQAEVMGYGFTPDMLPEILSSGLGDPEEDLTAYGYGNGSYSDWIADITNAYTRLYETYGPFTPEGLDEDASLQVQEDPMWAEFTAKMLDLYMLVGEHESAGVSYPWITYWYTGMTEDEVYELAVKAFEKYSQVDTVEKTIRTSDAIDSRVGAVEYSYIEGIQVTDNIRELWRVLDESGFDVWTCSASECDIIRAAIDVFGLHDHCTGLIAMTPAVVDGKLSCTYDYDTGYAWYPAENGAWERGSTASGAQPQGEGKVTAIQNICAAQYGCGPMAGFMDSAGDYNFCTEFSSLKLVVCFNRANRKVTDGGGVVAELAMYQKNELGYDIKSAAANGDTLYVLQGRDENGLRTFRNSNKTIRYGETEEKLYRDEQNEAEYDLMVKNKMTTEEAVNTFAMSTAEDDKDNPLGFKYGFLDEYDGYHSK